MTIKCKRSLLVKNHDKVLGEPNKIQISNPRSSSEKFKFDYKIVQFIADGTIRYIS